MSGTAEFDIDPVVPHVDLVLFDNVLSCYPCDKDITANYNLGEAVRPTTWDWVGVFRTDWRYLGEYVAYSWVPNALDVTKPRRRGISFPVRSHKIPPNEEEHYNFLYIAHGNHVVGVSSPFKVVEEERLREMGLEYLYSEAEQQGSSSDSDAAGFHDLTCSGFYDSYEIIDETKQPESGVILKKNGSCKRKIMNVYRDSNTLVNLCPTWPEKLRILDVHPVVQEYMDSRIRSLPSSSEQNVVPVFDAQWKNKQARTKDSDDSPVRPSFIPSIEYPEILSITAGPETFLLGVRSSTKKCPNCAIAKTLMRDLMDKNDHQSKRIGDLEKETLELKVQSTAKEASRLDKEVTVGILDWCLEQINDDNKTLRVRVRELERLLMDERNKAQQVSLPPKTETVDTGSLATTVYTEAETQASTLVADQESIKCSPEADQEGWIYKEPRRIERLLKAVSRHSRNIRLLRETIEVKKNQITGLKEENLQLRRLLRSEKDQTQVFCKLADELNTRIKAVLAERAKERTQEWRKLFTEIKEKGPCRVPYPTPCQTPSLTSDSDSHEKVPEAETLQTPEVINNDVKPKATSSKKHGKKGRRKEKPKGEQCKTCGLTFSVKTDRRVIQEHTKFHTRNREKKQ